MSNTATTSTIVDVADLFRRPGTSRPVRRTLDASLVPPVPLVAAAGPVDTDLLLESLVDGILARGRVGAEVTLSCARCLSDLAARIDGDVAELFSDPARVREDEIEEGYVIDDVGGRAQIDLATLVRDALSAEFPLRPLCRPDCAGLCALCGADRNSETCECSDEVVDDRWAALRSLDLPDGPG